MANHKQAEKRNRQKDKRRARNKNVLSALRTSVKKARAAIDGATPDAKDLLTFAISTIDKAVSKGVLKRETASRYISRLSLRANKPA